MRRLFLLFLLVTLCFGDCAVRNLRIAGVDALSLFLTKGADGVPVLVADTSIGRPGDRHYMSVHFNDAKSGLRGTHAPARPSFSQSFTIVGGITFDEYVVGSTTLPLALTPGVVESDFCDICSGRLGLGTAASFWLHERVVDGGALVTSHGIYTEPESCDVIPYEMDVNAAGDIAHSSDAATLECTIATPEICITTAKYKGVSYRISLGPHEGITRLPPVIFDDWTSGKPIGNAADARDFDDLCFLFEGTNGVDETVCFAPHMMMDRHSNTKFWVASQDPLGPDVDLIDLGFSAMLGMAVRFHPLAGMATIRPLPQRFDHTTFVLVLIVVAAILLLRNYFGLDVLFLAPLTGYHLIYPVEIILSASLDIATILLPWLVFIKPSIRDAMSREVGVWIVLGVVMMVCEAVYMVMMFSQVIGAYKWNDILHVQETDRYWMALTSKGNPKPAAPQKRTSAFRYMNILCGSCTQSERRAISRIWTIKQAAGGMILSIFLYTLACETAQGTLATLVTTMMAVVLFIIVMHTHFFFVAMAYKSTVWYILISAVVGLSATAALISVNHMTLIRAFNWNLPEAGVAAPLTTTIFHGWIFFLVVVFSQPRLQREKLFVYKPKTEKQL